ncbi:MAG: hypothetical protein Q7S02_02365, partial [bacterium]|nr:hypothetical protein [bacterium]
MGSKVPPPVFVRTAPWGTVTWAVPSAVATVARRMGPKTAWLAALFDPVTVRYPSVAREVMSAAGRSTPWLVAKAVRNDFVTFAA